MRTFSLCVALAAALVAGNLRAADISSPALARMGWSGVRSLSDNQGREVRGSPYLPVPADGGAFQVVFAHFVQGQYYFLPTSGFTSGPFAPFLAPPGGNMGTRGR
jgi:hypothetical protein